MAVISTNQLSKQFGNTTAVNELTMSVESGELFGFIGPNGAGKTTTINILTAQVQPTKGSTSVMGIDPVLHPKRVRQRIGILPEREDPPSFMTPREYFKFVADVRNVVSVEEKIEQWADRLLFSDALDTLTKDLSKGERQKVMIAQAFMHEPDLAFIDEPLINLDPIVQERVKAYFSDYINKDNTIFLSTHVLSLADELCSSIGIINNGVLAKKAPKMEIVKDDETLKDAFLRVIDDQASQGNA